MNKDDIESNKLSICKTCESCVYNVEANMLLCDKIKDVPIHLVVKTDMKCPLEKW